MYEALYAPIPDGAAYASRIGLSWPLTPDLETLDRIVLSHQCTVPFENIQCYDLQQEPSLEIPTLFDKVVREHRGGYCFELNALLESFLRAVGYDAWSVSCRIVRGKDFIPPMLHRGVLVRLDGTMYYCDVGYGGPQPSFAVPLDGRRCKNGEEFWGETLDDHWSAVCRRTSQGVEERVFEFLTVPMPASYFLPCNFQCSCHESSLFQKRRVINLRTPRGSLALTDAVLTEHRDGHVYETTCQSPAEEAAVLADRFGITVDPSILRWNP